MHALFDAAFRGKDICSISIPLDMSATPWALMHRLGLVCGDVVHHAYFTQGMTFVILLAGVTVGISTDADMAARYGVEIAQVDYFILYVFIAEVVLRLLAEGLAPWRYFFDAWNVFDFLVVALSLGLSWSGSDGDGSSSIVTALKLLRLLRVLKLMKAVPELQIIVSALASALESMMYIIVILFVFYYFCSVIAVTFLSHVRNGALNLTQTLTLTLTLP